MKQILLKIAVLVLCATLSACSIDGKSTVPIKEVSIYNEMIIVAEVPLQLYIDSENSNIEVYNWNRKEVKFEITKKVRGIESKDSLQKYFDKFVILREEVDKKISLSCRFKGGNKKIEGLLDLKIYIPKKMNNFSCTQKNGSLKFLDDLNCELNISTDIVNVEINRFEGKLVYTAKSGDLRISEGELADESSVSIESGNIRIKSKFMPCGKYSFKTGIGIIELGIPSSLGAIFNTIGQLEADECQEGKNPATFKLVSGAGKIVIKKF